MSTWVTDALLTSLALASAFHQGTAAHTAASADVALVRVSLAGLSLLVAALLARRTRLEHAPSLGDTFALLPSLLLGSVCVGFAGNAWTRVTALLFSLATASACVSLWNLGSSFAIVPAARPLRCGGAYRLVRHPAYASELAMCLVALATRAGITAFVLALLLVGAVVLRISAEERHLFRVSGYLEYSRRVRYRLIPGLW